MSGPRSGARVPAILLVDVVDWQNRKRSLVNDVAFTYRWSISWRRLEIGFSIVFTLVDKEAGEVEQIGLGLAHDVQNVFAVWASSE